MNGLSVFCYAIKGLGRVKKGQLRMFVCVWAKKGFGL